MSVSNVQSKTAWTSQTSTTKLQDLQEDKSSLLERLKEHGESSNVHGISHILTRKSRFRKCVWIVSFLGLAAFAGYQLMNIYFLYMSYPTQTNVKIDFKPLPFPMVSICNMNPIRLSQVENVKSSLLKAILRGDDISLAVNTFKAEYDDLFGGDMDYDTSENKTQSDTYIAYQLFLNEIEQQPVIDRVDFVHQINDLLMSCSFRGTTYSFERIVFFLSSYYGICYTINTTNFIARTAGPSSGLEMTINLETYEAVHLSEGYGLVLVLHGENQLVVPENDGIVLSGGTETHVKMKLTQINRQGYPYSDCANTLENGKPYSFQECLQTCFASMYKQICFCVLSTVGYGFDNNFSFYGYCRNSAEALKCATDINHDILQDTNRYCGCPASCSEKIYTTSISSRRWPNDRTRATLVSEACIEKDYCPLLDPDFNITQHQIETNFLKVMLYFEDLNQQLIEETPIYDATRLMSDVGGSVGLCLGVSLLCIVELIEVVLELCKAGVKKIFRR